MHDPPHLGGRCQNHQHGHEAHDADGEIEGQDRPLTPSHLQPPMRSQSDSGSDTSLAQSKGVEFEFPSPISPSRPRSPWALFDPYSNNEVIIPAEDDPPKRVLCSDVLIQIDFETHLSPFLFSFFNLEGNLFALSVLLATWLQKSHFNFVYSGF